MSSSGESAVEGTEPGLGAELPEEWTEPVAAGFSSKVAGVASKQVWLVVVIVLHLLSVVALPYLLSLRMEAPGEEGSSVLGEGKASTEVGE